MGSTGVEPQMRITPAGFQVCSTIFWHVAAVCPDGAGKVDVAGDEKEDTARLCKRAKRFGLLLSVRSIVVTKDESGPGRERCQSRGRIGQSGLVAEEEKRGERTRL